MSDRSDQLREQLVGFFFEESSENLELMEAGLVDIDPGAPDPEQKGASGSFGFGHISEFAHVTETVLDQVRAGCRPPTQEIVDALLQATDCLGIMIQEAQDATGPLDEERIHAVEATLQTILNGGSAPKPAAGESEADEAPTPGTRPTSTQADPGGEAASASSIRVGTEKVDELIDMVAELAITQSMLADIGERFAMEDLDHLKAGLGQLQRNTRELQDTVMKIRMLPMSATFARLPRLVRDLGQSLGKQVELRIEREQTELDKTVLEQIGDPLVHLVRNSVDHGLEKPEERVAAGKPPVGAITLDAFHQGSNIVIEVKDDGRGLDHERIRRKALERGLIGADEELDDARCSDIVFGASFSTAAEVSDVSGRGVGMDVVRRSIHSLGGTITLSSVGGQGMTTRIHLPLTLAILDGQLVRNSVTKVDEGSRLVDRSGETLAEIVFRGKKSSDIIAQGEE